MAARCTNRRSWPETPRQGAQACHTRSRVVTHHPQVEEALDVFERFERREDGIIKAVFRLA
jgi:threonine dehydrogenase-like Zn-dependent dehydrogenase